MVQVFDEPVAAPGDRTSVLNSCGNSEIAVVSGDRLVRGQVYCIDVDSDEAEASWEHRLAVLHSQLECKLLPKVFEECSRRCGGFVEGVAPTTHCFAAVKLAKGDCAFPCSDAPGAGKVLIRFQEAGICCTTILAYIVQWIS